MERLPRLGRGRPASSPRASARPLLPPRPQRQRVPARPGGHRGRRRRPGGGDRDGRRRPRACRRQLARSRDRAAVGDQPAGARGLGRAARARVLGAGARCARRAGDPGRPGAGDPAARGRCLGGRRAPVRRPGLRARRLGHDAARRAEARDDGERADAARRGACRGRIHARHDRARGLQRTDAALHRRAERRRHFASSSTGSRPCCRTPSACRSPAPGTSRTARTRRSTRHCSRASGGTAADRRPASLFTPPAAPAPGTGARPGRGPAGGSEPGRCRRPRPRRGRPPPLRW